jgi:glucose-1-phosphate adenylyltransferase
MLVNFLAESLTETEAQEGAQPSRISLDRVAVIILGGGEGTRLKPLTLARCKPAMSFGGRYTLIDIPISHSLTTGLNKIFVIGQYLSYSLQKHLFQTYLYHGIFQNTIQLLVPEERDGKKIWYKGTADAVRQNINYFSEIPADYFLILSGDQLYNINFQKMINFSVETDAGMVIAAQPVNKKNAKRMGLLKIEHGGSRIFDFYEKPQEESVLERFFTDDYTLHYLGYDDGQSGKHYLGSMGIYLFKRQTLFTLLKEDLRDDFGKHLIQTQMKKENVHAFLYDGYWEDIGTIESYYYANLALTHQEHDPKQGLKCYDEGSVIMTKREHLPGAKISNCKIDNAIVCEGSMIEAKEITHSVIGIRSRVAEGSVIRDSIVLGNEFYERPPLSKGEETLRPGIGKNCRIEKAIIDENVSMGDNVQLTNKHGHINFDSEDGLVSVRDGIIVIPRGAHIPSGYIF